MNAFDKVTVRPHWGTNTVVVSWVVPKEFYQGNFIVQRSRDGVNFETITSGIGLDHFVDQVVPKDRISEFFYKVILQYQGRRHDSPTVGTYGDASRQVFGMSNQIMRLEWIAMRRCHAIRIFRQKLGGDLCSCTDPDTMQRLGTTLCPDCFGTGFLGGFEPAIDSHMRLIQPATKVILDHADGTGSSDPTTETARMLPYPPLRKGDLIVLEDQDKRWLVENLTPYRVNDNVPVVYDANLQMLRRNDIRYKVE